MQTINRVPFRIVENEISIKLLEYLKRNSIVDDEMYNYVVYKFIKRQEFEKNKIDEDYINNIGNYKILT